jgi:isopentenyl-diphosphate delta-isomerase
MGLACELVPAFHFVYRAELDGGLVEHELDHVFLGQTDDVPVPDPREADAVRYVAEADVRAELLRTPEAFTAWFRMLFEPTAAALAALPR